MEEFEIELRERITRLEEAQKAQKEALASTLASADKAIIKAEVSFEKRLDSVNEFRDTLGDQQRMLIPRTEAEIRFKSLEDRISAIIIDTSNKAGQKTGINDFWGFIIGAIGLLALMVSFFKN